MQLLIFIWLPDVLTIFILYKSGKVFEVVGLSVIQTIFKHHLTEIQPHCIGKQRALSLEVTCNFRLNLNIGQTSVKPSWKHWIFTGKYSCLHTEVPYNRPYGWNRPNVEAQCWLLTYNIIALHITIYYISKVIVHYVNRQFLVTWPLLVTLYWHIWHNSTAVFPLDLSIYRCVQAGKSIMIQSLGVN